MGDRLFCSILLVFEINLVIILVVNYNLSNIVYNVII